MTLIGTVTMGIVRRLEPRAWQPSDPPSFTDERAAESIPLYRAAADEARKSLDAQTAELDNLRLRGGSLMTFVGSATSFLVGTTLAGHPARDGTFYALAIAATAASAIAVLALAVLLVPWPHWQQKVSARDLVEQWIEQASPPGELAYYRSLALLYDDSREQNERTLNLERRIYAVLAIAAIAQTTLWAAFAWAVA